MTLEKIVCFVKPLMRQLMRKPKNALASKKFIWFETIVLCTVKKFDTGKNRLLRETVDETVGEAVDEKTEKSDHFGIFYMVRNNCTVYSKKIDIRKKSFRWYHHITHAR